jgi:hypothetical protein
LHIGGIADQGRFSPQTALVKNKDPSGSAADLLSVSSSQQFSEHAIRPSLQLSRIDSKLAKLPQRFVEGLGQEADQRSFTQPLKELMSPGLACC